MRQASAEIPTIEQCSELLQRICLSSELKRAARLKDFLHYVGKRVLEGDHAQIAEYEIGVHVFGRAENYDTSSDNIVRVNASELRKRIAAYYAAEGVNETVLVEIPRGSYSPVFSTRPHEAEADAEKSDAASSPEANGVHQSASVSDASSWGLRIRHHALVALALLLSAACLYLFYQNRDLRNRLYPWKSEPTLNPFWSGILNSPRETDVVLADTSVAVVEDILNQRITLGDYLDHGYTEQIRSSDLTPPLKNDLEDIASRNNGSVSDFRVAQRILALDPNSGRLHLQYARDYRPRVASDHNIVLIGSSSSNPWCTLFENQLNFFIEYDKNTREMLVMNRHPLPGESAVYAKSSDPGRSIDFSVIDYIPNENHSADVLIIAGTNSEATEAAGNFVTTEESLRRFREKLNVRTLPYFELLLKTTRLGGTPLSAEIVAYRISPSSPLGTH